MKIKKILGYLCMSPAFLVMVYLLAVVSAPVWAEYGREIAVGLLVTVVIAGLFIYGAILLEETR